MTVTLYGNRLSPYVERIVLQTRLKGIEDKVKLTPPKGGDLKSAEHLAVNPLGKMPAIEIEAEGFCLPESGVVAEYIEDVFPDHPMLPADANSRALARLIMRCVDIYVLGPMFAAFMQVRDGNPNQGIVDAAKADVDKGLDAIEHFANGSGAHLVGDDWTLADCAMLPTAFFLTRLLPTLQMDAFENRPNLAAWHAAIMDTDLAKDSDAVMQKELEIFLANQG